MDLWDYSPIITSYNLYWLVFSTPLKNMIIIIIPYYTILSNTPPTSAAFSFSQSQSKSRLPSRPQSSPSAQPSLASFSPPPQPGVQRVHIERATPKRWKTVDLYWVDLIPMTDPWCCYIWWHGSHQYTPVMLAFFYPAPWIRHGIGYYQKSIFQGGIQENHAKRTIYCGPNPRNHPSYHGLLVISFIPVGAESRA